MTFRENVERGLVYLGYYLGLILILETLARVIRFRSLLTLEYLLVSLILWVASIFTRKLVQKEKYVLSLGGEWPYFLYSYTFVSLFFATLFKYIFPAPLAQSRETSSRVLNFFVHEFPFEFLVRMGVFFVCFLGLLFLSQIVFTFLRTKGSRVRHSSVRDQNLRLVSLASVMLMGFAMLQVPFVSGVFFGGQISAITYLRSHVQWLADYMLGSPVFYYLWITFRGSPLVDELLVARV